MYNISKFLAKRQSRPLNYQTSGLVARMRQVTYFVDRIQEHIALANECWQGMNQLIDFVVYHGPVLQD
ncbi:hypothetical protein RU639_004201 [Aspergillus parasiticus]